MLAGYFFLVALLQEPAVQIRGRVVGENGKPVEGVQIAINSVRAVSQTDDDGRFVVSIVTPPGLQALVRFSGRDIQPLTKLMASSSPQDVMVTVHKATNSLWKISQCRTKPTFGGAFAMAFQVPKNIKVRSSGGFDSVNYRIEFKKSRMGYGAGFNWSEGLPLSIELKDLSDISERDINFGEEVMGVEYRGIHRNGTYFRYIGKWGETVSYNHAPKDAALFFDTILDSLCHP
jgi:Carboxypeptidase regulatory-like domain